MRATRAALGVAALVTAALWPVAGAAQAAGAPSIGDCLACHGDPTAARASGASVAVDGARFEASAHGPIGCVECHTDLAKAELPHGERLARVTCGGCHTDAVGAYTTGVHAQARGNGQTLAARCVDCHGTHDILPSADRASRTSHFNLPTTCGRCHGDARLIARAGIKAGDVYHLFQDSIHGRGLAKSGLTVAPNCADCHTGHDIRAAADPKSRVHALNVAATCGTCHEKIREQFAGGIHGRTLAGGNTAAPSCAACHTAHQIARVETDAWKLGAIAECGTCHAASMEPYRRTFHGKVTELGFTRVAVCADCHGAHDILPASDPRSTIAPANLVATCGRCHEGASERFVAYDPHPNPHDYRRNRLLWYVNTFYTWLIGGLFTFFGVHTLLWFPRSYSARRAKRTAPGAPAEAGARDGTT